MFPGSFASRFALLALLLAVALLPVRGAEREAVLSAMAGATWETPVHGKANVTGDYGWRAGLALASTLPVGEMHLPLEIGLVLRHASLGFSDNFDRMTFTDLQLPFIVHGRVWKRLELVGLWTPSYTLDAASVSEDAGRISATSSLQTRFNMGFGGGFQISFFGIRLRAYEAHYIFSPFPASKLTFWDGGLEIGVPLFFQKAEP